ncbi:apacd-prov protein [Loa loa]|uniref:Thioredoxin domain-containing protein 9 n=1 Tax=Loa loa TaxID=7209 RepID=A0A1S0TSI8_LOALO|nr:apacd-prov protein [Loa loa]EFO19526.1 apacd-prov protein [Loa loa]
MDHSVKEILGEQLLKVVTIAEEEVDRQIEKYDGLDENDLEAIRKKRLQELKKTEWLQNGHGVYEEISDERSFFDATKKSAKVVCHFYLPATERCKIVDKHLKKIAPKYLEIRFIYANAEKFPFLTTRLKIRLIPTIVVIIDAKTVDYIRGFGDLGGKDEFRTEMLEWRLSWSKVLEYDWPSYLRGSGMTVAKLTKGVKKKVRGSEAGGYDDDDDD